MATQAHEIVSKSIIKPSSPTPNHLRHFKISLLDQLSPPSFYVPIVLFYSASDINANFVTNSETISDKLKASLSQVLTLYYPLCGKLKPNSNSNSSVECNDDGVLFIESKVPIELSNFLKNPQVHETNELFPFDPYKVKDKETIGNMVVKLNQFSCGGIALATCFSHNIVDASTIASFLNAWALATRGHGINVLQKPHMDAASLFPPRDIDFDLTSGMISHENIVTKRFVFDGTRISKLREKFGCFNPTRVEAVTALIWKIAMESSREQPLCASMLGHAVNFRGRMELPLPLIFGNLWQYAVSPVVKGGLELPDLGDIVRETIRKVNADYISKFQGDEFVKVLEGLMESYMNVMVKKIPCYLFTSWTRFDLYEADFGWGKPTWVCTSGLNVKNVIILMPTQNGDGIEAWISLSPHEMVEFESNSELLEFASITCSV